MSMLAALGNILFTVLNIAASIILTIFSLFVIGCAVFGSITLVDVPFKVRRWRERKHHAPPAAPPDVRPPIGAELIADPFVLDRATKRLRGTMAFEAIGVTEWAVMSLLILLALYPRLFPVGDLWSAASILAIPCLVIFVPWLALKTWRDARRRREVRQAPVVLGLLECLATKYLSLADGAAYEVELAYVFHSPAGPLLGDRFSHVLQADSRGKWKWYGAPSIPPFDGCPDVGQRVPVVVLYFHEQRYFWDYLQ